MRLYVSLAVALFLAPALASATSSDEPRDGLALTIVGIAGRPTDITWSPAPGALSYKVYRGPDLDHLVLLGETSNLQFSDTRPLNTDTWYEVVSEQPLNIPTEFNGPMRGRCLQLRGATGISVTIANCLPGRLTP